ncbi:hypothetical protein GCM10022226_12000 [Sphaerisporangium flaviroseum]|uniref:Uncharacterized protein n=1 Tax=Sphaerisporangium flaviroseum TaxID=509199 RepID=A0ABP7HJ43_9ACTN
MEICSAGLREGKGEGGSVGLISLPAHVFRLGAHPDGAATRSESLDERVGVFWLVCQEAAIITFDDDLMMAVIGTNMYDRDEMGMQVHYAACRACGRICELYLR